MADRWTAHAPCRAHRARTLSGPAVGAPAAVHRSASPCGATGDGDEIMDPGAMNEPKSSKKGPDDETLRANGSGSRTFVRARLLVCDQRAPVHHRCDPQPEP